MAPAIEELDAVLVTVSDTGSFSAAGRSLGRVQSVLAPPNAAEPPPLRSVESYTEPQLLTREQVLAALAACDGVREQTWRMLGLRSRDPGGGVRGRSAWRSCSLNSSARA